MLPFTFDTISSTTFGGSGRSSAFNRSAIGLSPQPRAKAIAVHRASDREMRTAPSKEGQNVGDICSYYAKRFAEVSDRLALLEIFVRFCPKRGYDCLRLRAHAADCGVHNCGGDSSGGAPFACGCGEAAEIGQNPAQPRRSQPR